MRVRMIFAEDLPDGQALRVGEVYDLSPALALPRIDSGRAEPETPAEPGIGLPAGFPHREALAAGGLETVESVRAASDAAILALPSVGRVALREIRAALPAET